MLMTGCLPKKIIFFPFVCILKNSCIFAPEAKGVTEAVLREFSAYNQYVMNVYMFIYILL